MSNSILISAILLIGLSAFSVYIIFFSPYGSLPRKSLKSCKSKRYFEAIKTLEQLLKIAPYYIPAWLDRGLLLSTTKQYTEAIESYDRF